MPPIDYAQVIIAVVTAVVTYFFSRRPTPTPPATPAPPNQLPDLQSPLVQGLLLLLKQVLDRNQPTTKK